MVDVHIQATQFTESRKLPGSDILKCMTEAKRITVKPPNILA